LRYWMDDSMSLHFVNRLSGNKQLYPNKRFYKQIGRYIMIIVPQVLIHLKCMLPAYRLFVFAMLKNAH
jgi:hypothetical protein